MRPLTTIFTAILTISTAGAAFAQQPSQASDAANAGVGPSPATATPVSTGAASSPAATTSQEANVTTSPNPPTELQPSQGMPPSPSQSAPAAAQPAATPMAPPVATDAAAAKVNPEAPLETGPLPVKGKWSPVMYGFVEFDSIHDSTESFNDLAGNAAIANPTGYTGKHGRTMFGVRNSRIGFKLSAPESNGIKTTGILEMDFLGNQPSNPPTTSEGAFFASPTFRIRHFALKLENPYVDVLLGQYWQLFGWQSNFHPNTVDIQGVPGQVYSRSPQARLSHMFKTDPVNVELAVAASRPPQRDSETPDGQAGIRLLINDWKGVHTMGGTGTAADAASVGVSGVARRFVVPSYVAKPTTSESKSGWGISTDVMLPVIPASMEDRANALTLTGSWVVGRGIADLFTGLSDGNTASWALPNPTNATPAPAYAPNNVNIDSGLIEFGAKGMPHAIKWQTYMGGIQYYLPPSGHLWISANYSYMKSSNILEFVDPTQRAALYNKAEWYDGNLFLDVTIAARLGVEYAHFKQTYGNDTTRTNHRVQFSGWLIF